MKKRQIVILVIVFLMVVGTFMSLIAMLMSL